MVAVATIDQSIANARPTDSRFPAPDSRTICPMLPHDIHALVRGRHADPSRCWGRTRCRRGWRCGPFWPRARSVAVVAASRRRAAHADDAPRQRRAVRSRHPGRRARGLRLSAAHRGPGGGTVHARRSLSLWAGADRLRSAPAWRRHARARLRSAGRAADDARHPRGRALRRVGAQRAAGQRGRRLQRVGRPRPSDAGLGTGGYWEIFIPDLGVGRSLQVRGRRRRTAPSSSRPIPSAGTSRPRRGRRPSCGRASTTRGATRPGWQARAAARPMARAPDVDLRGAPGQLAASRRTGGCSPTARWPPRSCPT